MKLLLVVSVLMIIGASGDRLKRKCFDEQQISGFLEKSPVARKERSAPIRIGMTESVTQRILSWLIKIYLNEVLGFQNVTINESRSVWYYGSQNSLLKISNTDGMFINMEEWIPLNHLVIPKGFENCTKITPIGIIGWQSWFVPHKFSQHNQWLMFKDPKFASLHPVDSEALAIIKKSAKVHLNTSTRCQVLQSNASPCTVLLAGELHTDIRPLINENRLFIEAYEVGASLDGIISKLLESYPSMFFILPHWYPSRWTYSRKQFVSVEFPPIGTGSIYFNPLQASHVHGFGWLSKSFPYRVEARSENRKFFSLHRVLMTNGPALDAPTVSRIINNVDLSPREYLNLSESFETRLDGFDIACDWLKSNLNRSLSWIKEAEDELIIGVVLPAEFKEYSDSSFFEMIRLVRKAVSKKKFPENYQVKFLDTKSIRPKDYSRMIGIVGPAKKEIVLTEPTVISYVEEEADDGYILAKFLADSDWREVAIITDDRPVVSKFLGNLRPALRDHNISVVGTLRISKSFETGKIQQVLSNFLNRVKIIVVDEYMDSIHPIVCAASYLNMTAEQGYVWFSSAWFSERWWRMESSCTTNDLSKVIDNQFGVLPVYFGPDDQIMQEDIAIGVWRQQYDQVFTREPLGRFAGFLYDACWTFIDAIDRVKGETSDALRYIRGSGAGRFREIISQTDFYGVSGRVRYTDHGHRVLDYKIRQFVKHSHRTGTNGKPHTSITETNCIFKLITESLNVTCWCAYCIVFLTIFLSSGILIGVGYVIFKKKNDKKRSMQHSLLESQSSYELDEWEIARNEIMIICQLGEGSFGKVYGGQVLLPEQGWAPVAVKLLKPESSIDEKSDFLSELKTIKSFDHPNLIKLIGACVKSEPVLAVLELMTRGDLKTYLLAGKSHVSSAEVGCERLTGMALDVVRALGYLDDLGYVHRDIACRNFLVDAEYVVKLGDFRMARSMHENDHREGLFPVRWMALESLDSSVFTPASDVWSFGILLYEIITLGGIPYEGKSNDQVIEYLRTGNILPIPETVKPTLQDLMKSCWTMDPTQRPTAFEIIPILEDDPCLIEPCFDYEYPNSSLALKQWDVNETDEGIKLCNIYNNT